MSRCGCVLRPGSREYRAALRALEATEARLRKLDRADGGHRLRDHQNSEARAFRQTLAACRKAGHR